MESTINTIHHAMAVRSLVLLIRTYTQHTKKDIGPQRVYPYGFRTKRGNGQNSLGAEYGKTKAKNILLKFTEHTPSLSTSTRVEDWPYFSPTVTLFGLLSNYVIGRQALADRSSLRQLQKGKPPQGRRVVTTGSEILITCVLLPTSSPQNRVVDTNCTLDTTGCTRYFLYAAVCLFHRQLLSHHTLQLYPFLPEHSTAQTSIDRPGYLWYYPQVAREPHRRHTQQLKHTSQDTLFPAKNRKGVVPFFNHRPKTQLKKTGVAKTQCPSPPRLTPSFWIEIQPTHDGEQLRMLHRKLPSLVPSLRGIVPASKSPTMRCAYMVSYACHRPVLQPTNKNSKSKKLNRCGTVGFFCFSCMWYLRRTQRGC